MKVLLLIILLLLTPVSFANKSEEGSIEDLANRICARMALANNTGVKIPYEVFEILLLNYLGADRSIEGYKTKLVNFWNENIDKMICTEKLTGYKSPQHILKRVIEYNDVSSFYFDYFLKDRSRQINSIEIVDGKPETLLDYIDKILAMPNPEGLYSVEEIKSLRGFITQLMNAKHAKDLLKE